MLKKWLVARRFNDFKKALHDLDIVENLVVEIEYDKNDEMYYIYHNIDMDNLSEEQHYAIIITMNKYLDSKGIYWYSFGNKEGGINNA